MRSSLKRRPPNAIVAVLALAVACGGSDGSSGPPVDNSSILGASAASYAEANEGGNGTEASSEVSGYTLDANGLRITGAFEPSGTTSDYFRINTGAYTQIDIQAFVNGVKQNEQNFQATISLNSFVNDGYSTLTGNGYFVNAWMSGTNKDYVVGISGPSGATYVLEMKAH